ncbi:hypothetical protein DOY81_005416 [Sarcophaga bullata]|nr:hypothetical protein DOY81_005416 [Sarcophaga bullata]
MKSKYVVLSSINHNEKYDSLKNTNIKEYIDQHQNQTNNHHQHHHQHHHQYQRHHMLVYTLIMIQLVDDYGFYSITTARSIDQLSSICLPMSLRSFELYFVCASQHLLLSNWPLHHNVVDWWTTGLMW